MIRISQQDSAAGAKRYYATADYYAEGQEIVGRWGGRGAVRLGLTGTVDKESFERLCDNLDPVSGEPLTVRTRHDRTVGYDFTFSVPKSVSLLYATSGDQDILEAFRQSVDETMREMENEMKTRVRKGRQDADRTTGNMVWAEFVHTTSRPVDGVPDPQLHAHVFVFNSTFDSDEDRWKAGQFRDLKRDAPYFQAAFRVRLANRLQDLGFGIDRKKDDFEIAGLPAELIGRFSRRTALIDQIAAERGIDDPDQKAELGAETREKKAAALSSNALRKEWESRMTPTERELLAKVHRREKPRERQESGESTAVDHAVSHGFVRESVVAQRKLLTEALKRGLGSVTVERTAEELSNRSLIRSEVNGRVMATTPEMLALESRILAFAREGRGRCRPLGDPARPITRDWFNAGQKAAVKHVLGSRDRVIVVRGVAGTGKTTLEQEIGEAIAETGRPVVAIAQSVKASREVLRQEAGFEKAETVARFLMDENMQRSARDGVILVDEASQIGTRDMHRIFEVADSVNARVVLVGDRRQHRSVTAGEPLKLLEEKAGLPVAEVTEILRQSGDYKKAAQALSQGHSDVAYAELDRLGWIHEVSDETRFDELANAYLEASSQTSKSGKPATALVVSPTHAEAAQVTKAIREGLKARGGLKQERTFRAWVPAHLTDAEKGDVTQYSQGDLVMFHQNAEGFTKGTRLILDDGAKPPVEHADRYEVYRPIALNLAVGDRIRVTAGGKTKDGRRLAAGTLATVRGFSRKGDIVVDDGRVIDPEFGHLTHGYVVTSHVSQGVTVDKVFVAVSGRSLAATDRRTAYVSITRGKKEVRIFTDDKAALAEAMKRPDEPMSATDLEESRKAKPKSRPVSKPGLRHFDPRLIDRNRDRPREADHVR